MVMESQDKRCGGNKRREERREETWEKKTKKGWVILGERERWFENVIFLLAGE